MCGLNRATAWRLLMTLEEQGMVARNPHNGWFTLGPTFLELRASVGRDGLVEAARPVLERLSLETGETACLGLIDGDTVHYIAEVIPAIADEESWLEHRVDLHAASMGKAFLAYLDPAGCARSSATSRRATPTTPARSTNLAECLVPVRASSHRLSDHAGVRRRSCARGESDDRRPRRGGLEHRSSESR